MMGQTHQRWDPWPLLLLLGVVTIAPLGLAQRAGAHANLLRAIPEPNTVLGQPPAQVTLWFSERIAPAFSAIQVLDAQGQRVDHDDNTVDQEEATALTVTLPPVPHGLYTVAWKNVSMADGHRVRGAFVFAVGTPLPRGAVSAPAPPLFQSPRAPALRGLVLLSTLAVVGGVGFVLLVSRALPAGRTPDDLVQHVGLQVVVRTVQHIRIALAVAAVASVAQLLDHTAVAADRPITQVLGPPLAAVLTGTDWGYCWLARVGLLLLLAVILGGPSAARPATDDVRGARSPRLLWATVLSGALLLTLSLTSHGAATLEIRASAICADFLHLLAAAVWGGGLLHLALSLWQSLWSAPPAVRRTVLAALVPRFSLLASGCVSTVLLTGAYTAWAQVLVLPALRTPYGVTLLVKLALVLPLLGLGALNLLWVRPRLAQEDTAGQWLRRAVTGEALLMVVILAVVGVLTSLEPARQVVAPEGHASEQPVTVQDTVEGLHITLTITPGRVGLNRVVIALRDRRGLPVRNASQVELRLEALEADLGAQTALATAHGDGTYGLDDAPLSLVGAWQVQLVVRRPDAFDARTAFRIAITAGGTRAHAALTPPPRLGILLWGGTLLVLGGLFVAIGLPLRRRSAATSGLVMATGGVCVGAAFVFLGTLQWAGPEARASRRNPFPPTAASIAVGQRLYAQRCVPCHGPAGRGDGPLAPGLRPPPADLVQHVPLHADPDLFASIHDGIAGTAMAPFGGQMTAEEIWHTVNYLKTLGQ
jgi:copper transport protein